MSDVAVHLLPTAMAALGHIEGHAPAVARVVLTGAGGGTWDLLLGDADLGNPPDVVLQADTIGFCRMAGGRLDPAALAPVIEGDEALGHALVAAGAALAMP